MNSSTAQDFYNSTYQIVAIGYSTLVVVVGAILAIFGDFHVVFNAIDHIAMIYFLFFTNAIFPVNILDFSKLFGPYLYEYVPNPITSYSDSSMSKTTTSTSILYTFSRHSYTTDNFLFNSSYTFLFIGAIIVIYLILKLLSCISYFDRLRNLLRFGWEWNALIHLLVISSNQWVVFAALQSKNISFDTNGTSIANLVVLIICTLLVILSPFNFWYCINSRRFDIQKAAQLRPSRITYISLLRNLKINYEKPEPSSQPIKIHALNSQGKVENNDYQTNTVQTNSNQIQLQSYNNNNNNNQAHQQVETHVDTQYVNKLTEEAQSIYTKQQQSEFSSICKYTNVITMLRRVLFGSLLVFANDYMIISLGGMILLNVILAFIYIFYQPHVVKLDNYRNFMVEIEFIALEVIILFFDTDVNSTSVSPSSGIKYNLGWAYVFICLSILLIILIDLIHQIFRSVEESTDEMVRVETAKKVQPIPEDSMQENPNNSSLGNQLQQQSQQHQQQPQKEQGSRTQFIGANDDDEIEDDEEEEDDGGNSFQGQMKPQTAGSATESVRDLGYGTANSATGPFTQKNLFNQKIPEEYEESMDANTMEMKQGDDYQDISLNDHNSVITSAKQSEEVISTLPMGLIVNVKPKQQQQQSQQHPYQQQQQQSPYQQQQQQPYQQQNQPQKNQYQPQQQQQQQQQHPYQQRQQSPIQEVKQEKERIKQALFKRNPFISEDDEILVQKAKKFSSNKKNSPY